MRANALMIEGVIKKEINNLVIVESPAKAKTIEKYLGSGYTVKSSFGHIRDLPKKGLSIDIDKGFKPTYAISPDKVKIVRDLQKEAKGSTVWLASDEDREGEAIAWHLTQALGLDPKTTKRIVFHEITKPAIEYAIANPRTVDEQLVDAQQARRILDRLVGYELSPVLWRKVRTGLSAGRVQSVAVRLCVEREREIRAFAATGSYKIEAIFDVNGEEMKAALIDKLPDKQSSKEFLENAAKSVYKVTNVSKKPGIRTPGAPFTTSTLQQEAARRLGYSVRQTMQLTQRLYEAGHITYMRTDSTTLSSLAIHAAEEYITKAFKDGAYHKSRQFKTKNTNAQEAHEAIRPTDFYKLSIAGDAQQDKMYKLIWQRTLASQMSEAKVEKTEVEISISEIPDKKLVSKGEVLKFDGFMRVYGGIKDDTLLPPVSVDDILGLKIMTATEIFSHPQARYSEASLVRKLEELGIGRPSTYAPTISTIQTRGYIEKTSLEGQPKDITILTLKKSAISENISQIIEGADRDKLIPTPIADITTDFLVKYFPSIVDYDFTAKVEEDFDLIADGKQDWGKMLKRFYDSFHPLVINSEKASRQEVSQARKLGVDPKTHQIIYARIGRYGPVLQRGETDSEQKPDFAPLPKGINFDLVTIEDALPMFSLPRKVGKTSKGLDILANIGRFGPYIQVDKTYVSLKDIDPFKITEQQARKLYEDKLEQDANKYIHEFKGGVKVVNGPYGPYITDGKKNAKIPKDVDPSKLKEAEAKKLLKEAPTRRFSRRRKGSKVKKPV